MPKPKIIPELARRLADQRRLIARRNRPLAGGNGIIQRWRDPVVTAAHVPIEWRYDLNPKTNPLGLERLGINCAFNPGAMVWKGRFLLAVRVEGADRKSFFAIAESRTGVDGFRFWDEPVELAETADPATNLYDMRLTAHEDGWIYGLFCAERQDPKAPPGDLSSAIAACGIARTKDLVKWERLPDLVSESAQQRNVVLHPEFVKGKYALYTRPQDSFLEAGSGGGIGWALCETMERAVIHEERIMDRRGYHTIKELKNGQGPVPLKTPEGWLSIAHGVRNTAAGMRYVLYAFLSDLNDPAKVLFRPGGYLVAPDGEERVGDVSNVTFCNGAVGLPDGRIFIYYASSDTRCHVGTTTVDRMLDYCMHTPEDSVRTSGAVAQRLDLIRRNRAFLKKPA